MISVLFKIGKSVNYQHLIQNTTTSRAKELTKTGIVERSIFVKYLAVKIDTRIVLQKNLDCVQKNSTNSFQFSIEQGGIYLQKIFS